MDQPDQRLEEAARIGKQLLERNVELEQVATELSKNLKLKVAELELVTAERDALQSKTTEQKLSLENLQQEVSLLTSANNSLNESIARSKIDYAALNTKYRQALSLTTTVSDLTSKHEERTATILKLENEIATLKQNLASSEAERVELLTRVRDLSEVDAQYQNHKGLLRETIEQLQESQVKLSRAAHENVQLTSEIATTRKQLELEQAAKFELQTKTRDLKIKVAELEAIYSDLTAQLETYKAENVRLNLESGENRAAANSVTELSEEVRILRETQREFGVFRETMSRERDSLTREVAERDATVSRLTQQLVKLKSECATKEGKYMEKYDELEDALRAKYELETRLRTEIDELRHHVAETELKHKSETVSLNNSVTELRYQLDKDTRLIDEYKLEINRLNRELKLKGTEIETLSDQILQVTKLKEETIARIRVEHDAMLSEATAEHTSELLRMASQYHTELAVLKEELRVVNDQNSLLETKWKTKYERDTTSLREELKMAQKHSETHDERLSGLKNQITDRDQEIARLEQELKVYRDERDEQQKIHTKLYTEVYDDLNGQIRDLQTEVKMWKDKYVTSVGVDAASAVDEVKRLHIELSRLRVERDMLAAKVGSSGGQKSSSSEDETERSYTHSTSESKTFVQVIDNSKILIEGIISKKSRGGKWKDVYAFIEGSIFYYSHDAVNKYKAPRAVQLLGALIKIENTTAMEGVRPFSVSIKTDKKTANISFKNMEEMKEWYTLMKKLSKTVDPTK